MASTYLSRTPSSAGNTSVWTASFWIKCSSFTNQDLFNAGTVGTNHGLIFLNGNQQLEAKHYAGSFNYQLVTNRRFRDCNAWYHIVVVYNDLESTSSDRIKFYINGVQETSFATATYPSLNFNSKYNETTLHTIGRGIESGTSSTYRYFDGSMSHFHWIDGTAYAASTFGETDSTTGIWKPKTAPSVTYGTNGFFLKFENSAAFGTDSSGNSNTFTVNGTMTQNIDTPSNVFATLNPLQTGSASVSNAPLTNGNNTFTSNEGSGVYPYYFSTLGMSSGKYYVEFKFVNSVSGTAGIGNGVADQYSGNNAYDYSYYYDGRLYNNGSGESTGYGAISNNDILGCALDLDNNKIYFHINGTYQASGDPANGTGGKSITAPSSNGTGFYQFEVGDSGSTSPTTIQANFGNGFFGTTAVSSAQNPDDGIGIFEYDVPAGYRALNTKSINAEEYS